MHSFMGGGESQRDGGTYMYIREGKAWFLPRILDPLLVLHAAAVMQKG